MECHARGQLCSNHLPVNDGLVLGAIIIVSGEGKVELGLTVFTVTNLKVVQVENNKTLIALTCTVIFRAFGNGSALTTRCQPGMIKTAENQPPDHHKQYPD